MDQVGEQQAFGKIRSYVWPIHSHEIKKVIPMVIMLFLICFNYSLLRNLKDSLVITAKGSGAEVIPFIKVWVIFPAAVLCTMFFSFMTNRFSREFVFKSIIGSYVIFFTLFAFWIYPNRESLHPNDLANFLTSSLPAGCKGLIAMFRNWTLTGFYVAAELWGSMVLMVLFWGFANEITKLSEATRFYSVMSIASNCAAIIAGQAAVHFASDVFDTTLFFGSDAWEQTLVKLLSLIIVSSVIVLFTFSWMNKRVLSDESYIPDALKATKKSKKKMSFRESLTYIAKSRYLFCIATIVVAYNLVINLVEVIWKDRLSMLYPSPHEYNLYINNLTSAMGVISTTASLLMVGLIQKLGWTRTALLTPCVLLTTTIAFFACLFGSETLSPFLSGILGTTPLALAVLLGSIQNCFTKAAKYSVFDVTKEMAFIPLDPDHKLKGKAAIDGIGSRLGKSGGSVIHQGLLLIFGTLGMSAPYVAVILLAVMFSWILAVREVGRAFVSYKHADQKAHKEEYTNDADVAAGDSPTSQEQSPTPA